MAGPEVICITNGAFAENCYVVGDRESGEAVLVDPGEESDLFLRRLDSEGFTLQAVWLTHAHLDHILGVSTVVRERSVDVCLHPADRSLYEGIAEQGQWFGLLIDDVPPATKPLAGGDRMSVGGLTFDVLEVPGHSPGSVAFVGHGVALVGDALFAGSIGRVDLPGGDADQLLTSIRTKLLTLPDSTVVHSGHGPETTIGQERASNPFLTGAMRVV